MSDSPETTPIATVKPAKRAKVERTPMARVILTHAKKRGIDPTRAGKEVRAKARREFDTLAKLDPSLLKAKTHANDGNRWPALNAKAVEHILTRKPRV